MTNDYVVQRRIKQHKLRRKARRGEIALRRLYKFIRFIFVLFIFYGVYRLTTAHYWYLPQNIYDTYPNKHIEILGNTIVSDEKIVNIMKQFPIEKKQIYKINPANMAREIEALTPVKRAYIRRYWLPTRYIVMIEEVNPVLIISPSEEVQERIAYAITGELISGEYLPLKNKNNVIKILSYGTKGDDYEKWDIEKIENLYKLAKMLEGYSGEKVKYIDMRDPHKIFVELDSVKIKLGEIDVSVYERIKAIQTILPEIKNLKDIKAQYIDLSWQKSQYIKEDVSEN